MQRKPPSSRSRSSLSRSSRSRHISRSSRSRNRSKRNWKTYLGWLPRIYLGFLVVWLFGWATLGDSVPYLGYINAGGFIFGLLALATAIIFAARREFLWAVAAFMMSGGILLHGNGLTIGAGEGVKSPGTLRIVSASLRGRNDDMAAAAQRLNSYDADIIAVQEVIGQDAFIAELEKASGKSWNHVSQGALMVLSKLPLAKTDGEKINSVLKAAIQMPGGSASIWNMRAPKSYVRPVENSVFYGTLTASIAQESPDFVVGDYNATQWNNGYAKVSRLLDNAQAHGGFGAGSSFPAPARRSGMLGAYARIDHIFVGDRVDLRNAFTGEASAGADHHPVIADIKMGF